jgi:arginine N-succinyltransferase
MTVFFDVALRPCRAEDLDQVSYLTNQASYGLTSLVKDRIFLKNKIEYSLQSFSKKVQKPLDEEYFFVLENIQDKRLIGLCGIKASTGSIQAYYSFKVSTQLFSCPSLNLQKEHQILQLKEVSKGPSELCSLFLDPEFRKLHLSKLLSFGCFHFMNAFKHRFQELIVTQLCGIINDKGYCPFYEGLCKHFFGLTYQEACKLRHKDDSFIKALLPKDPIFVSLLTKEAQEVVGKCHERTQTALKIILNEGFYYPNEIDIFDGGPDLYASFKDIKTVKNIKKRIIKDTKKSIDSNQIFIASNSRYDFRACYAKIEEKDLEEVFIEERTLKALKLKIGDTLNYSLVKNEH